MKTIDLDYETRINRVMDRLAAQRGVDGPEWYQCYDDLRAEAEQALAKEQRGEVTTSTWLVVAAQTSLGYSAVEPDAGINGCTHTVSSPLRILAQAAAIDEHRRQCLGW